MQFFHDGLKLDKLGGILYLSDDVPPESVDDKSTYIFKNKITR